MLVTAERRFLSCRSSDWFETPLFALLCKRLTQSLGWWATTPKCSDTHDDGINCCLDDELWSTCFIRLGTQVAGQDCSTVDPVTASKCTWDGKLPDSTPPEHRAQIRYTLQAIFTVQAFFTTYGIGMMFSKPYVDTKPCNADNALSFGVGI